MDDIRLQTVLVVDLLRCLFVSLSPLFLVRIHCRTGDMDAREMDVDETEKVETENVVSCDLLVSDGFSVCFLSRGF